MHCYKNVNKAEVFFKKWFKVKNKSMKSSFFKKEIGGHMYFYGATDTSDLDFWWFLLWVSIPKWKGLFTPGGSIHDVHSLRFTSGVTPVNLLTASMMNGHCSPNGCFSRGRMKSSYTHQYWSMRTPLFLCTDVLELRLLL